MKLLATQADLNAALRTVARAVSSGKTHPILAGVLLTATDDGKLAVTAYDLDLGITTTITAAVETPGSVVVPHRLLSEIAGRLSDAVSLALDGDRLQLTAAGGSYSLSVAAADDFPALPAVDAAAGAPVALQDALSAVLPAVSHDAAKQLLTGVHVAATGGLMALQATDGHRLAVRTVPAELELDVVVPGRTMALLREPCTITTDGHHVSFSAGTTTITSRVLDGRYPDVQALVPATSSHEATCSRVALLRALERIAVIADSHNSVVKLSGGKLTAEAEANSGAETIALDGKLPDLACNVHYLIDGVKGFNSDTITIRANSSTTPVVLSDGDSANIYLVMPVQIRG
jgi:DNA polymerase-3 subunit beta